MQLKTALVNHWLSYRGNGVLFFSTILGGSWHSIVQLNLRNFGALLKLLHQRLVRLNDLKEFFRVCEPVVLWAVWYRYRVLEAWFCTYVEVVDSAWWLSFFCCAAEPAENNLLVMLWFEATQSVLADGNHLRTAILSRIHAVKWIKNVFSVGANWLLLHRFEKTHDSLKYV